MKKILSSGPGIVIGIPTLGRPVPLEWALNFKGMNPPINFNINYSVVYGKEVGEAREIIAEEALEKGAKYLFFLGDDVVAPPETIKQLIYRMEQNSEIAVIGGVYCSKCDPSAPLVFKGNGLGSYWDWKIGEFFECTGVGMDCTIIRVDALKGISRPWFKTVETDEFLEGKNQAESWTEDLYFCKKLLEETPFRIFCDGAILCSHWDVYGNKAYKLPFDSLPMRVKGLIGNKKKALSLGPVVFHHADFNTVTAEDECKNPHSTPDYRVQLGRLPFEQGSFDIVYHAAIANDSILNHSFLDWIRVAKPGAKVVFNFDDPFEKSALTNFITCLAPEVEFIETFDKRIELTKCQNSQLSLMMES